MSIDWNKRFIDQANNIASWSKDKSKGVGCVIVNDDKRVVSMGYNGFPSGFNDDAKECYERPQKYFYTEHAERNAIYNAARQGVSTIGCTLYVTMFPCHDCARAIIQSGIKKVVCEEIPNWNHERWGESFGYAMEMLSECKVDVEFLDKI